MNVRVVKVMAIAIGLCVVTAASSAMAKEKAKHGVVSAVTVPSPAVGSTPASFGSIEITETDKTTKVETKTSYQVSESTSFVVNGDPSGSVSDALTGGKIAVGDKVHFKLSDDGKTLTSVMKGRKPKPAN